MGGVGLAMSEAADFGLRPLRMMGVGGGWTAVHGLRSIISGVGWVVDRWVGITAVACDGCWRRMDDGRRFVTHGLRSAVRGLRSIISGVGWVDRWVGVTAVVHSG
jgi:hypothetical protein